MELLDMIAKMEKQKNDMKRFEDLIEKNRKEFAEAFPNNNFSAWLMKYQEKDVEPEEDVLESHAFSAKTDDRWSKYGLLHWAYESLMRGRIIHSDMHGIAAFMNAKSDKWYVLIEEDDDIHIISQGYPSRAELIGSMGVR